MAKSTAEIFEDKVRLIYEYNNQSPLFVRAANNEIENNNVDRAIEILNRGIEIYPQYATAYLLLGRAYTLTGNYSSALNFIRKGSDLTGSKKTLDFYFRELENNKKQRAMFRERSKSFFIPGQELLDEKKEDENTGDKNHLNKKEAQSFDDRLDEIAKEISSVKIPEPTDQADLHGNLLPDNPGSMIISETLAKIYTAQGELREAIEVYKKLIMKDSSKEEYYLKKINELKSRLEL